MRLQNEPRSELFTLALTQREKNLLAELAQERGATMSGMVRKLIHDAARGSLIESQLQQVGRHASNQ